jgi:hypothetical protein
MPRRAARCIATLHEELLHDSTARTNQPYDTPKLLILVDLFVNATTKIAAFSGRHPPRPSTWQATGEPARSRYSQPRLDRGSSDREEPGVRGLAARRAEAGLASGSNEKGVGSLSFSLGYERLPTSLRAGHRRWCLGASPGRRRESRAARLLGLGRGLDSNTVSQPPILASNRSLAG